MPGNNNQSDTLKRPFPAYEGSEPYIFISYAHKDAELVFPEIKRFYDEGYPVWYDQGLTPGQEWDDEVADALLDSTLLVIFISRNSMASNNVQDEIKLALEEGIDIVPIYFEETKLPSGLRLRLSNKHAIFKHVLNDTDYIKDCFKAFDKSGIPQIDDLPGFDDESPATQESEESPAKEEPGIKAEVIEKPEMRGPHEVYISYSTKDKFEADRACHILEENGIKCWIAPRDIKTGNNFASEILNGVKNSKMVLCIFSKNSHASSYVQNEIDTAFTDNLPILAFRIDGQYPEGKMGFYLKNAHWIDAYCNPDTSFDNLVKDANSILKGHKKESVINKVDLSKINRKIASKRKIYLCYDEHDVDIALSVCRRLEQYGFNCWMKNRDSISLSLVDALLDSIKGCDTVVLIYSKNSAHSNFVDNEIDIAFTNRKQILVFKVDETEIEPPLEFFLHNQPVIDASKDYNDYIDVVVKDVYELAKDVKSSDKGLFKSIRKSFFK